MISDCDEDGTLMYVSVPFQTIEVLEYSMFQDNDVFTAY